MKKNKNGKYYAWKVTYKLDNTSAIIENSDVEVKYILNKWVFPKHDQGPLFVFDTRKNARNFKEELIFPNFYRIYKAEVKQTDSIFPHVNFPSGFQKMVDVPFGTMLASSVKLIKKQ